MLCHTYSPPSLLPGGMGILVLVVNYLGLNRSRFTDGYVARPAVPTVIPPGVPYTPVHTPVHLIVEQPRRGHILLCKNHQTND